MTGYEGSLLAAVFLQALVCILGVDCPKAAPASPSSFGSSGGSCLLTAHVNDERPGLRLSFEDSGSGSGGGLQMGVEIGAVIERAAGACVRGACDNACRDLKYLARG